MLKRVRKRLRLGNDITGNTLSGNVKAYEVLYFDKVLTKAELENLYAYF